MLHRHCEDVGRDPAEVEVTALTMVPEDAGTDAILRDAEELAAAGAAAIVIRSTGPDPTRWLEETWGTDRAEAGRHRLSCAVAVGFRRLPSSVSEASDLRDRWGLLPARHGRGCTRPCPRRVKEEELRSWGRHGKPQTPRSTPGARRVGAPRRAVGTDEIDALAEDLGRLFPTADDLHADPEGVTERWLGRPVKPKEAFVWPDEGPGFRPDQQRWSRVFPFPGTGALNRICVHPSIVDFAERALDNIDIRLYQAARQREVRRRDELRAADAHRPQPFLAPPGLRITVVEPRGFSLPHRCYRGRQPNPAGHGGRDGPLDSPYGLVLPNWDPAV